MNNENKETIVQRKYGFSLIELLFVMGILIVVLAAAFGIFKSMNESSAAASHVYELASDEQAILNLIRLDLQKAASIPSSGVNIPAGIGVNTTGGGYCATVGINNRTFTCGDGGTMLPVVGRDGGGSEVLDAVTPITVNGSPAIIILYEDNPNIKTAGGNGDKVRLDNADNTIRTGDFILLRSGANSVLRRVSKRICDINGCSNDIDLFSDGEDSLSGAVNVTLLRRVAYYRRDTGDPAWLMRQVNGRAAERLVPGLNKFNMSYDLVPETGAGSLELVPQEGVSVADFFDGTPNRIRDIRRVNVEITLDSEWRHMLAPADGKTLKGAQMAGIAVRRNSTGSCSLCDEEWSDTVGACVPKLGAPCDAGKNQFWSTAFDSCGVCPEHMKPTRCGCERRCPDLDQYWDPLSGSCKNWKPLAKCTYDGGCDKMKCDIDGCGGNGDQGKYSCTVSFYDDNGKPISVLSVGKRLPPGITSATQLSSNAFSSGKLQIGSQNNPTFFPAKHKFNVGGVTVAFMSYTDGNGDKSPIMPIRLSSPPACTGSPLQCSAYYDDQCISDCRKNFETDTELCNRITSCRIGGVCSR